MNITTIYFVRHGLVQNPRNIFYGRLPRYHLSEEGQQQAQAAGAFLAQKPITAIFSSPLLRTRQTAQLIQQAFTPSPPHHLSDLLLEVHTPFDGHTHKAMEAIGWDLYGHNQPGYEQPADILKRVQKFCQWVVKKRPGQEVVAVTHGDLVAFSALWAMGEQVTLANRRQMKKLGFPEVYPTTAGVLSLMFDPHQPEKRPEWQYQTPY